VTPDRHCSVNDLSSVSKKMTKLNKIGIYLSIKIKLGLIWQNLIKIGTKKILKKKLTLSVAIQEENKIQKLGW